MFEISQVSCIGQVVKRQRYWHGDPGSNLSKDRLLTFGLMYHTPNVATMVNCMYMYMFA
jgi:hypothetical protein